MVPGTCPIPPHLKSPGRQDPQTLVYPRCRNSSLKALPLRVQRPSTRGSGENAVPLSLHLWDNRSAEGAPRLPTFQDERVTGLWLRDTRDAPGVHR